MLRRQEKAAVGAASELCSSNEGRSVGGDEVGGFESARTGGTHGRKRRRDVP